MLTLVIPDSTGEDISPVAIDLVSASSATCTISHSVPSNTVPRTDISALRKEMNQ